jgi:cyclohexanone monooxygenase
MESFMSEIKAVPSGPSEVLDFDAVVIGAGFAGLYMLHKLRELGLKARVFETGDGVGGTWFWNRYPGARCDVESMQYSYSFSEELQQEWQWTERYPKQAEILCYINHVADRFNLRADIQLKTRVTSAAYDEAANTWTVSTDQGDVVRTRFLISAGGCLSAARVPDLPGLAAFKGKTFHTGAWPHKAVDFTGQRVGVIGTGSSGIQSIPAIAAQASKVVVFQRTANFSIPAWNRLLPREEQIKWKANYADLRKKAKTTRSGILYDYSQYASSDVSAEERQEEYERRWAKGGANYTHAFNDIYSNKQANDDAAEFVRNKIRAKVKDPEVAELLAPKDHAIGTKRICVDTDYYETFNQPHVSLVDLRATPIQSIVENGVQTSAAIHELDSIVFATGYDAVTGALDRIDIRGKDGRALKEQWTAGPRTYLGLMVSGFPNFFLITGPGSPSVLTNVIMAIEQHVEWIANCLQHMRVRHLDVAEPALDAQEQWVAHVNEVASKTLFTGTQSWYMGANIPGKPRVFLPYIGGLGTYTSICNDVVSNGYRGFQFQSRQPAAFEPA